MAYEDIYARYKNLYDAQNNSLAQKKDTTIQGLNNNKNDLTNQYTDIANGLKAKQDSTKNQYQNLYKGLDQQNVQAKDQNYTDRNNVDVGVNQNLNRVQELMAKNGWLGGGENLQAQLQSGSDRMNGFGNADKGMNDKFNTILNDRNNYQGQEQSAMNDINNQISSADREKATKLQAIMDAINSANTNYNSDSTALKANLDAQAQGEIYNAEQAAKAQAFQAQQSALSRSASASKASSAATKTNGLSYKDYFTQGNNMLGSTYLDGEGNHVNKYSNDDVLNWLSGLNMAPEDKARLANDLGLQKQASSPVSNTTPTANIYDYVQRYGLQ
jgi:hypothetical protein